jgi:hypothetical protein
MSYHLTPTLSRLVSGEVLRGLVRAGDDRVHGVQVSDDDAKLSLGVKAFVVFCTNSPRWTAVQLMVDMTREKKF